MPNMNYNVGIRFDAMGNFMKSMDKFGEALGALSGGLGAFMDSLLGLELAGVGVFAALTKGAEEYNQQLIKMRMLHIDAANRLAMGQRAQRMSARATGFTTAGLMGLESSLYQSMGGARSASSPLVRSMATAVNYLQYTMGMKHGAAEHRAASMLGGLFSFERVVHPHMAGAAVRKRAEHAMLRDIQLGGRMEGLAGAGSSRQYFSLLDKMMASPWVQGHMTLRQMGAVAFRASALGLGRQEMPIIKAAYGPLKGNLPALFSALGFGIRTGGMLSAISGNAIRLSASKMGHMLVNDPEGFMRRVFLPGFEHGIGIRKTKPWRDLTGEQRRSILSDAQTVLGGTFFAKLFHSTFGTAIGERGTALHKMLHRDLGAKAAGAHKTNIQNLVLQLDKLWKILKSITQNLGSVLIPIMRAFLGLLTAFAEGLNALTGILPKLVDFFEKLGIGLFKGGYGPKFPGAAKPTAALHALERKYGDPLGWFQKRMVRSSSGGMYYTLPIPKPMATKLYNTWIAHGRPMAHGRPNISGLSWDSTYAPEIGKGHIVIHNGTFNIQANDPKAFGKGLRDSLARNAEANPVWVTPQTSGGHKRGP